MKQKTVLDLRRMKADSQKIVMVTAYDATMARLVDAAGVDVILVGDSLGMVVQGHDSTLPVTLDHMVYHCANAWPAGCERAHLVGDLPFMSYQVGPEDALRASGRMVQEGRGSIGETGGRGHAVAPFHRAHRGGWDSGSRPTSGSRRSRCTPWVGSGCRAGPSRTRERLLADDASAVQDAGAFLVSCSRVSPSELAARQITETALSIPTIGIGAGVHCDGQVLVSNDLLGMDLSFEPRFVKRFATLETTVVEAIQAYASEVRAASFPAAEHSFERKPPARIARLY